MWSQEVDQCPTTPARPAASVIKQITVQISAKLDNSNTWWQK